MADQLASQLDGLVISHLRFAWPVRLFQQRSQIVVTGREMPLLPRPIGEVTSQPLMGGQNLATKRFGLGELPSLAKHNRQRRKTERGCLLIADVGRELLGQFLPNREGFPQRRFRLPEFPRTTKVKSLGVIAAGQVGAIARLRGEVAKQLLPPA